MPSDGTSAHMEQFVEDQSKIYQEVREKLEQQSAAQQRGSMTA